MLITFEGIDGSGKTTQAKNLYNFLKSSGLKVKLYREPGGTEAGESIREIVIKHDLCVRTELLLFEASRAELMEKEVLPALSSGILVILDRYVDSTTAYQHYGRGIEREVVEKLNEFASHGLKPDITFLLDISPDKSIERIEESSRFDKLQFLEKVREGFLSIAMREPDRVVVLNSDKSAEEVFNDIVNALKERFPERFKF